MDIKENLIKIKRVLHRNREEIARGISITLTVIFVIVLGFAAFRIIQSDKQMELEASQPKDESKIQIKPGWDYGESGFNKVAENANYILEADYTTGEIRVTEKKSGYKWYSNPPDRKNDMIVAMRSRLNSQLHITFLDMETRAVVEQDNYTASIKKGGMSHELVENGVKFTFAFPVANVYIPVQYTLCDDGFQAEILTSEIERVGSDAYVIETISFLPFFGAAGLEDDGYLFVPDGSGALINYNNGKQACTTYSAPVYGRNPTLEKTEQDSVKERISLPVFGGKTNDHAYIGVVVSGDSSSVITGYTSRKTNSYNTVYSTAVFREYSLLIRNTSVDVGVQTRLLSYSDELFNGKNYTVRYFFAEGEKANYTGMAELYRNYLEKSEKLKNSDLADDKYLVLDLVGAVSIEKYVMGIKRPVVTAMTTYNEVVEIVKELKSRGVDNIIINYIGALDGGLDNKMYSKVTTESSLGTKKEFRNMISYLEQEGVKLFLETNPVDLYNNGNGYDENRDTVKTFFNKYAFQYKYELDSLKPTSDRWHLLHPALTNEFVNKFVDSAAKWNIKNISLDRLGEVIYTDYADDVPSTTKMDTLEYWQAAMKSASEKADYLMVHGGNAYVAPYADVITDSAEGSSDFDMVDQTVPFYQLVFQNNTVLTTAPLNTTVDYTEGFLKALETGCSLKYNLVYGDVSALVGTKYNTMVSYSYEFWKDIIVEEYLMMNKATQAFAGEQIVRHEMLDAKVSLTEYESGTVIVNYSDESYTYQGTLIGPRDYLVLAGGAK